MSADDDVLAVNREFYQAFKDFDKMDGLWERNFLSLFCLHPGQEPLFDRTAIMDSWRQIITNEQLNIAPTHEQVLWFASFVMVICDEVIAEKPLDEIMIASNLYMPDSSGWKMVGHHSGRKTT